MNTSRCPVSLKSLDGYYLGSLNCVWKIRSIAPIPYWVVISCHTAMALGTLFGGWRIVKTMGLKITYLKPFEGFCAETAGAITLFSASILEIPVSTTHRITCTIIRVGAIRRLSVMRWCDHPYIVCMDTYRSDVFFLSLAVHYFRILLASLDDYSEYIRGVIKKNKHEGM